MAITVYPSVTELMKLPGLLYWNPTTLATEVGWGTKLGYTKGSVFIPGTKYFDVREVYHGEELVDVYYIGDTAVLTVPLRNYNVGALARVFPGLATGATVKSPGSLAPGTKLSTSHSGRLLFVPDDQTNNVCVLFQKCVSHLLATANLLVEHSKEFQFPAVFKVLRKTDDADGRYYVGLMSGAVLR